MVSKAQTREHFEQLARAQMGPLYSMAMRLTRQPQEAEDLVQETLLRAYRFFDKFEQGSNFKAWLFKILKNSFINRYRKAMSQPDTVDFGAIEEGLEHLVDTTFRGGAVGSKDPERSFMDGLVDGEIEAALAELPEEYRMVLLMSVVEEMTYQEIASALSCPIGTVMSRLHRARRQMQAKLSGFASRRGLLDAAKGDIVDIAKFRRTGK